MKKTILSATTTTGNITLGNYIGAISNWKTMLEDYHCYFMVANLHSLTSYQEPKELLRRTNSFFAQYVAMGLDPEKCTLFTQSQVPEHAELQWVLSCMTPLGNLNRMTQFKDKTNGQKSILSGMLMYPVLMASDILLYGADLVPVGADQLQHLELTRDIVDFFDHKYGALFTKPEAFIPKKGARIMSLVDPSSKMSKSDENENSYISILDAPKVMTKKIKRAVTDSGTEVIFDEENKGIANLMTIYSVITEKSFAAIEKDYSGKMYGHLKADLAEIMVEKFRPIQERYQELINDQTYLSDLQKQGALKAREKASETLGNVYERLGLSR